jgi:peptidoglycan/xylan/chitin deacetylase (PgdA/CDA1 family)
LAADLAKSGEIIEGWTGVRPTAIAWPFGATSEASRRVAQGIYELQFGSEPGFAQQGDGLIPRFGVDYREPGEVRELFRRR